MNVSSKIVTTEGMKSFTSCSFQQTTWPTQPELKKIHFKIFAYRANSVQWEWGVSGPLVAARNVEVSFSRNM
jgi:hypothetical protein